MDPDAALRGCRTAAQALADGDYDSTGWVDVVGLIDHFQALDEYLSKGGRLPDEWRGDRACEHRCTQGKHCGGCGCPGCGYSRWQ